MRNTFAILLVSNFLTAGLALAQTSPDPRAKALELPDGVILNDGGVLAAISSDWRQTWTGPSQLMYEREDAAKNKTVVEFDSRLNEAFTYHPATKEFRYTLFENQKVKSTTICIGPKACVTFDHGLCKLITHAPDKAAAIMTKKIGKDLLADQDRNAGKLYESKAADHLIGVAWDRPGKGNHYEWMKTEDVSAAFVQESLTMCRDILAADNVEPNLSKPADLAPIRKARSKTD